MVYIFISLFFASAIGVYAFFKQSIAFSGLLVLLIVCAVLSVLESYAALWVLFAMFASSSALSKCANKNKEVVSKSGPRDYIQALANLGPAVVTYLMFLYTGWSGFLLGFISSVAAANADTWASEIGSWSKKSPVSIINLKRLPQGVSGGVSLIGTVGGVLGGAFICIIALYVFKLNINAIFIAFLISNICFVLDSVLGALWQALYYNSDTAKYSELPEKGFELQKGFTWLNNDGVNFLSTLSAVLLALGVSLFVM